MGFQTERGIQQILKRGQEETNQRLDAVLAELKKLNELLAASRSPL